MPTARSRVAAPRMVSGCMNPQLVERAVDLIDGLRQSTILPYVMESSADNITQNSQTRLPVDDFKVIEGAPFLMTGMRYFATAALAASASGGPFANVSIRVMDNDRMQHLTKNPTLLASMVRYDSNTLEFDRPLVMSADGSFGITLTEENVNGTTDVFVSMLGEVIAGGKLDSDDLREAVALGVYPAFRGRHNFWDKVILASVLRSEEARCLTQEGEEKRWALRARVAELRQKLCKASFLTYIFESDTSNIPKGTTINMLSSVLRNDSGFPVAITRIGCFTGSGFAASATGSVFNNISVAATFVGRTNFALTSSVVMAPCLFDRKDNNWLLDRPLVVGPDEGMEFRVSEEDVNATTDVNVSVQGYVVHGLSTPELQECISLGLINSIRRTRY